MEPKTKIKAEEGTQELFITRVFDLPVDLVFKAYTEAELVALWMETKVLKLESKRHGSYEFETTDPMGNKHLFNGTIHEFVENKKITRTFEMNNAAFGIQLEYMEFEAIDDEQSKLSIHTVFKSVELRDQLLKLPFSYGLNLAHQRLEKIFSI